MKVKIEMTDEQKVQDLFDRYDFEQDGDYYKTDKDGKCKRRGIVLTNKTDSSHQRFVRWDLCDGMDDWYVTLQNPCPPKEEKGVKSKKHIYIAAALRFIQEHRFLNRCKAPAPVATHGQCERCGGDLICEMDHFEGTGYAFRFVCYGRSYNLCDYMTDWR